MKEFRKRAKDLVTNMPQMKTRQYVDESCSLIADLLEKGESLEETAQLFRNTTENYATKITSLRAERDALQAQLAAAREENERMTARFLATDAIAAAKGEEIARLQRENADARNSALREAAQVAKSQAGGCEEQCICCGGCDYVSAAILALITEGGE